MRSAVLACLFLAVGLASCSSDSPPAATGTSAAPPTSAATSDGVVTSSAACDELAATHRTALIRAVQAPSVVIAEHLALTGPYLVPVPEIFANMNDSDESSLCVLAGYPTEWGDTSGLAQIESISTLYVVVDGSAHVLLTDTSSNITLDVARR